ncbi:hypothetical protein AKJ65_06355, partial [candidate division MSBL1 archaeon SCGC-AAA259E19]
MSPNLDSRKIWMISIFYFVGFVGILMQLRGSLLPEIKSTFEVSETLLGLVAPSYSVSLLILVILIGMKTGSIDIEKFLMIGIALTTLFTLFVGVSFSFPILLLFFLGRGVGTGVFRALDRPILSHLFPENRGWTYNMHTLAWAVGATSGPLLANLFLHFADWRTAYLVLSLGFIPILILFWKIDLPEGHIREETIDRESFGKIFESRAVIGMAAILFLNGGIEGGFFTWLPYFVNEFLSRSVSNVALSGFLAAYIPGRYIYGRLSKKYDYLNIVLLNAVMVSALILFAFYMADGVWKLPFIFACGFPISGIFPTMLAMGTDVFPQFSGPMNAIGMGVGMIGVSIFPWIMGIIADLYTVTTAMQFMLFLSIS